MLLSLALYTVYSIGHPISSARVSTWNSFILSSVTPSDCMNSHSFSMWFWSILSTSLAAMFDTDCGCMKGAGTHTLILLALECCFLFFIGSVDNELIVY